MGARGTEDIDPTTAAAESQLDRVDEAAAGGEDPAPSSDERLAAEDFGIHVDDPEADLLTDDLDAGLRDDTEADAIDALAEAFNARDVEGMTALLAEDAELAGLAASEASELPEAVQDLWRRRPTGLLTRGFADPEHVGVLWEHDGSAWWASAVVHVDDATEGSIGVLEFSDDAALLERVDCEPPSDEELEEGARWQEWDEGAES